MYMLMHGMCAKFSADSFETAGLDAIDNIINPYFSGKYNGKAFTFTLDPVIDDLVVIEYTDTGARGPVLDWVPFAYLEKSAKFSVVKGNKNAELEYILFHRKKGRGKPFRRQVAMVTKKGSSARRQLLEEAFRSRVGIKIDKKLKKSVEFECPEVDQVRFLEERIRMIRMCMGEDPTQYQETNNVQQAFVRYTFYCVKLFFGYVQSTSSSTI